MTERNILSKMKILAKFSPPFLLTALFRISSLSMCFACNELTFYLILPAALLIPILILVVLKSCGRLDKELLVADLAKGTAGELSSIVLWGNTGREGSRVIQLWIGGYLLVVYSIFLGMVLSLPDGIVPPGLGLDGCRQFARTLPAPTEWVIGAIVAGCLGYILSIYQLFLFDFKRKLNNLTSLHTP